MRGKFSCGQDSVFNKILNKQDVVHHLPALSHFGVVDFVVSGPSICIQKCFAMKLTFVEVMLSLRAKE